MTAPVPELVDRLRRFDTSTISDACQRSGSECHVVTGIAPLTAAVLVAGAVVTVQLGPAADSSGRSTRHLGTAAVEAATSDNVIMIDHQGRADCAGWGGNLSRGARQRGCAGTIIDGAARDIDEASAIGYPVFGRGSTPISARGRAVELSCQTTIEFAGVRVRPGDFVIADSTGVVIIPQQVITDVLDAAAGIAAQEEAIVRRINDGTPISEAMGRDYERMLQGDGADAD